MSTEVSRETLREACCFLSSYLMDLEWQASAGVGMWNLAGNGTPEFKDDEDSDDNMAAYIRDLEAVLNALKEGVE